MHFARIKDDEVTFIQHHRFLLFAFRQEGDIFIRQPVSFRCARRLRAESHAFLTFEQDLNIQIASVIFGAALRKRLRHIFSNQIEQTFAVDVVLTLFRRIRHVRFNVLNRLTQLFRQPGIQVVNIADNHFKPLN